MDENSDLPIRSLLSKSNSRSSSLITFSLDPLTSLLKKKHSLNTDKSA